MIACNASFSVVQRSNEATEYGVVLQGGHDKQLSCRREAARRFVSLNISLSHSTSLEVIRNDTIRTCTSHC